MKVLLCVVALIALSANAPKQGGQAQDQRQGQSAAYHGSSIPQAPDRDESEKVNNSTTNSSEGKFDWNAVSAKAAVRQANAAEEQITLAYIAMAIGFATTVAAVFAACFAKDAANHARNGVKATLKAVAASRKSNDLTRTMLELETRPFVVFAGVRFTPRPGGAPGIAVFVKWENRGKLPARLKQISATKALGSMFNYDNIVEALRTALPDRIRKDVLLIAQSPDEIGPLMLQKHQFTWGHSPGVPDPPLYVLAPTGPAAIIRSKVQYTSALPGSKEIYESEIVIVAHPSWREDKTFDEFWTEVLHEHSVLI